MTSQILAHYGFEGGYLPGGFDDTGPVSVAVVTDQKNSGSYSVRADLASNDQWEEPNPDDLPFTRSTVATPMTMGIAFRVETLASIQQMIPLIIVSNGTSSTDSAVGVKVEGGIVKLVGAIGATGLRSDGEVFWSSGVPIIEEGNWYYLELEFLTDSTVGALTFAINGVEQYAGTGLDTDFTTNGVQTTDWGWGHYYDTESGATCDVWVDDIYVAEDTPILGPQVHEMLSPTSSVESDGTGSDGNAVDNHLLVDDVPFDGVEYVDLDTATDREVYGLTDTANTGVINAISVHAQVHNPDAGSVLSLIHI